MNLLEDKDCNNTIRISARGFKESPFLERQDTKEMIRGVYAGRYPTV